MDNNVAMHKPDTHFFIFSCLDGVSVLTSFAQSLLVLVSTSNKFPSLDESWSQHPRNFSVCMSRSFPSPLEISKSLDSIDIFCKVFSFRLRSFSVLVLSLRLRFFSLGLILETQTLSVSQSCC